MKNQNWSKRSRNLFHTPHCSACLILHTRPREIDFESFLFYRFSQGALLLTLRNDFIRQKENVTRELKAQRSEISLTNLWTHIFLALLGPEIVFDTSSPWFFRSLVQQDEARHPPRHAHISLHIRFLAFSQDQKWKHRQVSNLLSKSTLTLIINSMLLTYCHRPGRDSCVIRMRVEVQLVVLL